MGGMGWRFSSCLQRGKVGAISRQGRVARLC